MITNAKDAFKQANASKGCPRDGQHHQHLLYSMNGILEKQPPSCASTPSAAPDQKSACTSGSNWNHRKTLDATPWYMLLRKFGIS